MYKEKLIDLLKSDDEIKKEMFKNILWYTFKIISCYTDDKNPCYDIYTIISDDKCICSNCYRDDFEWEIFRISHSWRDRDDYIYFIEDWCKYNLLPLKERFIRMYCNNNINEVLEIQWDWRIYLDEFVVELDDTKDFDNQDDEVYKKIYEALYYLNL